ncbi:signal recognition particle receptor subunit alpha, partial [Nocardia gipuzkoensis]
MTAQAWILIAAIAAVLVVALVSGFVLYKRRRVTLTPAAPDKELTDKSGGYTASGGFNFSQGGQAATLERTDDEGQPHIGDDAAIPRDSVRRTITDVRLPEADVEEPPATEAVPEERPEPEQPVAETPAVAEPAEAPAETAVPATPVEEIEPTSGRLVRLRGRLARSQNAVGKSLLGLLGGGDLDEDSWEEIEDTLVMADLGTASTTAVVERLREELAARTVRTPEQARQ